MKRDNLRKFSDKIRLLHQKILRILFDKWYNIFRQKEEYMLILGNIIVEFLLTILYVIESEKKWSKIFTKKFIISSSARSPKKYSVSPPCQMD